MLAPASDCDKHGSAGPGAERLPSGRSYGVRDGVGHQPDDQEDDQPHHDATENAPGAVAGRGVARIATDILDEPVVAHVTRDRRSGDVSREVPGDAAAHESEDVAKHPEATGHEALSVSGPQEKAPRATQVVIATKRPPDCALAGGVSPSGERAVAEGRLVAWPL